MTLKIFWLDPYLTQLDTRLTRVDGDTVTVAETIFYAFSGGQESDSGTIGGIPVRAAVKDGLEIYYTLESGYGLKVGDPVRIEIDWPRRYRLMRLHFAAELVLELAYRSLTGVEKVGAHIAEDKARIDFVWGESLAPLIPGLQAEAQAIVDADSPILSAFTDEASERRTWEVPGFARVPCGGTHLKRTGEVGKLRLKRNNPGKGKERIDIFVE
jgi:Ser-tRNA(Ala) deacylase AlaX